MSRRRRPSRNLFTRMGALVLLLAGSVLWPGCAAEKRYKVLSFFFDGVPDPNAATAQLGTGNQPGGRNTQMMVVFGHKPYVDGNCNACHVGGTGSLYGAVNTGSVTSSVCITCHSEVPRQYPVMHGPVAAVECLWCHAPHEANDKALLRQNSPDVCLQCHTRELLSAEPPEHQAPAASCLECHFAHGAQSHGLLRSGRPLAAPTTVPALPARGGGAP